MNKKLITITCFLLTIKSFGQTVPTMVNFKTPEVTAFNRFIETPVSQYTGVPNISIPLYEINIKGVNVPIKLDYHAGGIRVDQDATWVGLGWNLSYGGEISRKVRGIPDENYFFSGATTSSFGIDHFMKLPNIGTTPNTDDQMARHDQMRLAKYGIADYMPDEFYYSALGYSGRYMFNQGANKFVLFPKEDILVQKYAGSVRKLDSWNLKLPDGVSVDFGKEGYTGQSGMIAGSPATILNSWQIKSIRNNYNDSISYSYDNFDYRTMKISGQQYRLHSRLSNEGSTFLSNSTVYDSKIKTITFPNGKIEFTAITREDSPGFALSEINVFNANNVIIKTIKFNYEYFYGNSYEILTLLNPIASKAISDDYKSKRLKLTSISITALNTKAINYAFDYYTADKMPSKYSFSQDHWGYYNGIPNMTNYGSIPDLDPHFKGGDRSIKPEYSKIFTLKSIVYPEGGKSEFVYENNNAGTWNTPSGLLLTYKDDNFKEKYEAINVSSYSRNTNYPDADETIDRTRYFRKRFTTNGAAYPSFSKGWSIYTNFGISEREKSTPQGANNVNFTLERINPDNSRTLIKSFNTTPSNSLPRIGTDESLINITGGTYEMTVKMVYLNQPNTPADNQPYNLSFVVSWRELDSSKDMVNVGGLRIKDINYYNMDNNLVKKKSYKYINPYANAAIPEFTSGRIVSFPKYFENRMNGNYGALNTDWIVSFSSNSILPLETTSGSYAGYEYVDEYDVDPANAKNNLRTAYHFSFTAPYFSQYYDPSVYGIVDSKEWSRGKLLNKKYYKGNIPLKSEDFDYYYWSPHLTNDTKEDYVDEINTDFISFQALRESCQCQNSSYPDDFYNVSLGINDNCVYYYYTPFDNYSMTTAGYPIAGGGIPSLTCSFRTTVPYFKHTTAFDKIKSKKVTTYDEAGKNPVIQTETYNYGKSPVHYQLTNTTNTESSGNNISIDNSYPLDLNLTNTAETGRLKLIDNHQINTVLSQTRTKNKATEVSKTDYKVDKITGLVVPDIIKTNTLNGNDEIRNVYYKYDNKGNILSLGKPGGVTTNYIWSYNGQYPVAEIKNVDYETIISLLGQVNIENFSKTSPDKKAIDAFLLKLQSLPNVQLSSYVYSSLVGIISQTDPKGMTIYYEYDALQRLLNIKDQDGYIIKNFQYHYVNDSKLQ